MGVRSYPGIGGWEDVTWGAVKNREVGGVFQAERTAHKKEFRKNMAN